MDTELIEKDWTGVKFMVALAVGTWRKGMYYHLDHLSYDYIKELFNVDNLQEIKHIFLVAMYWISDVDILTKHIKNDFPMDISKLSLEKMKELALYMLMLIQQRGMPKTVKSSELIVNTVKDIKKWSYPTQPTEFVTIAFLCRQLIQHWWTIDELDTAVLMLNI